jgi:enoyl-CoA hydratase/carnithine racemase
LDSADSVRLEIDPPFARLILDRPGTLNAIDEATWKAIPALLDAAERDSAVRVLLLSGADARAFSAGADLREFPRIAAAPESADAYARRMQEAMRCLARFAKPSIAIIQGVCLGGGCGLALCCDFRFADDSARFGITPAKIGLVYPLEDTKRLVDLVGVSRAKDILMTARLFGADEALTMGLVDRVLPAVSLWAASLDYGREIAQRSQFSVRAGKAILAEILAGAAEETGRSRRLFLDGFAGVDLAEGVDAFLARRPPRFPFS